MEFNFIKNSSKTSVVNSRIFMNYVVIQSDRVIVLCTSFPTCPNHYVQVLIYQVYVHQKVLQFPEIDFIKFIRKHITQQNYEVIKY